MVKGKGSSSSSNKSTNKKNSTKKKTNKTTSVKKITKKTVKKESANKKPVRRKKTAKKKKSLFPSILLIGGIFFLMLIVIVAVIMNLKVNKLKEKQHIQIQKTHEQVEVLNTDLIDSLIKSVLFDYNISKDKILEHSINKYEKSFFIDYKIKLKKKTISRLKDSLYNHLKKYGFHLEDKENKVYFYRKQSQVTFEFVTEDNIHKPIVIHKDNNNGVPKISIIIDDAGRDITLLKKLLKIKYPITIATIPYTSHDVETVRLIKKAGKTPFLHQPCEPKSYPENDPGKGALFTTYSYEKIKKVLTENFKRLKGVEGFNNHMGSALTENREKMIEVLKVAKHFTDIFVDSRTTPNTIAYDVCKKTGLKCGQNKKFIDNEPNHNYIKARLIETVEYAKKNGKVIIIGHLKPDTVSVLLEYLPVLEKKGIKFVNIREVLD